MSDVEQALASRERLAGFVAQAAEKYDASGVWLLGFSQGAILSYGILSRYPALVQRYIPLSGYVEPGIIAAGEPAQGDSRIKALAMHGTLDPVIPIAAGRGVQPFLKERGVDYQYHEFPIGHGISPEGMTRMRQWTEQLLRQDDRSLF